MATQDSRKATLNLGEQEVHVPRFSLVVGDDDECPPPRRFRRNRDDGNSNVNVNNNSNGLLLGIIGILALAFIVLMFWLAFASVKEGVESSATAITTAVNSHTDAVANGLNAHNDGIANAVNANVNAARDAINNNTISAVAGAVAQDNTNTAAVRGDIAKASADGISATNAARDAIKAEAQAEAQKTRARIWNLTKAVKANSGGATKADIDAASDKLQAWMEANKAKVTVTPAPAPAPSAAPQPVAPAGGNPAPGTNPGAPQR